MVNPWGLVIAGTAAVALATGSFVFGMKYQKGQDARAEQLIADVREQAQLGAAEAIAKNKPQTTIIKQQLETITRVEEVYRDCRHTPDAMRLLNDALTGEPLSASGGELPKAGATDR